MIENTSLPGGVAVVADQDADLVRQVQGGDAAAFGPLVTRYQDRVYNAVLRITGHAEDARELTQEAFLKAFESLRGFAGQSGFYTWLFRIAVNLAISHRRKSGRRSVISLDGQPDPSRINRQGADLMERRGGEGDPAGRADRRETNDRVVAALNELDVEQRTVVVLKDIESLEYEQIAEILSVPVGTVKSRLHRARMALRERLRGVLDVASPA